MARLLYLVVMINGKNISFYADSVDSDESTHRFSFDGEVVAEFERRNIAGYVSVEEEEEEDGDN